MEIRKYDEKKFNKMEDLEKILGSNWKEYISNRKHWSPDDIYENLNPGDDIIYEDGLTEIYLPDKSSIFLLVDVTLEGWDEVTETPSTVGISSPLNARGWNYSADGGCFRVYDDEEQTIVAEYKTIAEAEDACQQLETKEAESNEDYDARYPRYYVEY